MKLPARLKLFSTFQLRNFISMGGPSIIIAGNSEYAKAALREIWERAAYKNYKVGFLILHRKPVEPYRLVLEL